MRALPLFISVAAACALAACEPSEEGAAPPSAEPAPAATPEAPAEESARPRYAAVDAERLLNADSEPGQWMTYNRTYTEERFSPLDQITEENVDQLGLAWYADYDTNLPQESTPLFIDGVIYVTTAWSKVYAFDARTGEELWKYDPEVPGEWNVRICCGLDNRGAAAWNGKIYIGTLDGRLIAIDAETGEEVWDVNTIDREWPYSITHAPRVVKGKVLVGNSGAELGVRGYVSAYDAETGELAWRFYTVPGNPADGFENEAMRMAAETWTGEWWTLGGGGTVWDAIVYDPITDLLYIGTGNGSPWNAGIRSPEGGDNLFLASIVALDPDDGSYVWHYQETPGDTWDYASTQHIIVTDLEIGGETRRVLLHAPKSGIFYVVDARTGELVAAKPFTDINWATGVDMETGRPIEVPGARFYVTGEPFNTMPGPAGAHGWAPMSFSPETGLVYLPVIEMPFVYAPAESFTPARNAINIGIDFGAALRYQAEHPDAPTGFVGRLIAWDPVAMKEVWRTEGFSYPQGGVQPSGGALATAGGLVFHGNLANHELAAYRATDGEKVWSFDAQTGIHAGAISYELDGEQYIAVSVGGPVPGGYYAPNYSRLLVFKLGGTASLPEPIAYEEPPINATPQFASAEVIARGATLYAENCSLCHGGNAAARATFPDLRRSGMLSDQAAFNRVVLEGVLSARGMAAFGGRLSEADAEALRAYIISTAQAALAAPELGAPPPPATENVGTHEVPTEN